MVMMTENEFDGVFIIFRGLYKKIIGRKLSCRYISKLGTYRAIIYNSKIIEINDDKILIWLMLHKPIINRQSHI